MKSLGKKTKVYKIPIQVLEQVLISVGAFSYTKFRGWPTADWPSILPLEALYLKGQKEARKIT